MKFYGVIRGKTVAYLSLFSGFLMLIMSDNVLLLFAFDCYIDKDLLSAFDCYILIKRN